MKATFTLLLAALTIVGSAQQKTAGTSVNVSEGDIIDIQTKEVYLEVIPWEKNEVSLTAQITYKTDAEKAVMAIADTWDEVTANMLQQSGNTITISAEVQNAKSVSKLLGIPVGMSIQSMDYKIHLTVRCPSSNLLKVNARYKDVALSGDFDQVEMMLYSADLRARHIEKGKLNLKYGSFQFEDINEAELVLYEQKLNGDRINSLTINTKYSDLDISSIGQMEAIAYETDYTLGTINQMDGNYKYGEMEISEELLQATLTLYETDIEAGHIEKMTLENSKYSKIKADNIHKIELVQSYEDKISAKKLDKLYTTNTRYGEYKIDELNGSLTLKGYEDDITIRAISPSADAVSLDGRYLTLTMDVSMIDFKLLANTKYGHIEYDKSKTNVRTYIKENDQLEIEAYSKNSEESPFSIMIKGYEIKAYLN